jgi:hypothetical protein
METERKSAGDEPACNKMGLSRGYIIFLGILVTGCVEQVSGSMYYDGRFWYSNVKSSSDQAGGPRQDLIVVIDRDGRVVNQFQASGPGTLQSLVGSLAPAVMTAAGQAAAGALQRPARNTTNVEMNVQGTGGSGGSGGSNVTSAAATSAGSTATATGGQP